MSDVLVVGGGPAGLSAALFAAKNGLETVVFDTDDTWMHKAHLFNYLGIGSRDGTAFLETARRQADSFGVDRRQGEAVTDVEAVDGGFRVHAEDEHEAETVRLRAGGLQERRPVLRTDAEVVEQVGLVHLGVVGVEDDGVETVLGREQRRAEAGGTAADHDYVGHGRRVRSDDA